ncbi:galactosyltransferase-related protein [Micromonospora sp. RP3T]|uniref:galactosyltransferase-related protein n=1 Tax=Micromonospora sp. RP3T TaxID=2135446 RepID=UPI000D16D318|nr:galactosyltransferase-related protein [Micromonospora sp. RP3T]PTA47097.1 hypothetical protein C8054_06205 [Micromonospora sp. RP3T]
MTNRGGCLFVAADLFYAAGGYDERFEGRGDEDNEFFERIAARADIPQWGYDLVHLHHARPVMDQDGRRPNEWLSAAAEGRPRDIGRPDLYSANNQRLAAEEQS